jgi:hypothetical protein
MWNKPENKLPDRSCVVVVRSKYGTFNNSLYIADFVDDGLHENHFSISEGDYDDFASESCNFEFTLGGVKDKIIEWAFIESKRTGKERKYEDALNEALDNLYH